MNDETALLRERLSGMIEPMKLASYGRERVYSGIGDYQGGRLILQIVVYLSEIPTLIPATNRPVNTSHIKEIKDYILCRAKAGKAWILGSPTVNVDPNRIKWQSIGYNLYVITIPNATTFKITDGQHRIRAIAELMALEEHRSLIADEQICLTLVLDSDARQADLDFGDMAQTMPLPSALLVAFGAVGRDAIAQRVAQKVNLFLNNTHWFKASPGTGSSHAYTLNYIAQMVGCAVNGDPYDELKDFDTSEKVEGIADQLSEILNYFFSICPVTAPLVKSQKLSATVVAEFRNNSILGLSIGLEILGLLIHQCLKHTINIEQIATMIDWSRNGDWWSEIISPKNNGGRLKLRSASGHSSALASLVAYRVVQRLLQG